jgi:SAM-dependent methyltransferase
MQYSYLYAMDIYGRALAEFYKNGETSTLWLHNSYDEPEEMPIDVFFRAYEEMPELELQALNQCTGKILDVGAGAGSHALLLQQRGLDVTAIDICEAAVQIMKQRGVKKARVQDICSVREKYDTLLFLMNGIGLTGTLPGFANFLTQASTLIHPGGQLIFDSSDISYLYQELPKSQHGYFGEVSYCYEYKGEKGNWFKWLYLDQTILTHIANQQGWNCEILADDGEDQYLARLTKA